MLTHNGDSFDDVIPAFFFNLSPHDANRWAVGTLNSTGMRDKNCQGRHVIVYRYLNTIKEKGRHYRVGIPVTTAINIIVNIISVQKRGRWGWNILLIVRIYPEAYIQGIYHVLTLTHRYNAVRGHRTGSNNSGAENYLRRKTKKNGR